MIVAAFAALTLFASQQAGASVATAPASPTSPSTTSVTATTTPPAVAPDAEQICRRQPIEGSRRQERVCRTKAEWDALRDNARGNRDSASRVQREGF